MSTIINADTSDGLKFTSDTSGEIKLQSGGTDIATVSSTGIAMASGKAVDVATALSTASGSAPSYSARAWVLFDGGASPTVNGSGNISSVVQVASGVYGITLANAMPDINYVISNCGWTGNQNNVATENDPPGHRTTTYFEVVYESVGAVKINNTYNSVMVLR